MNTSLIEAQLRDRPEDWDAWLVYADALAEQGDARGQLITLEHRLVMARLDAELRERIEAEILELVAAHEREWTIPGMPEGCEFEWRRGFIVGARFPLGADELAPLAELLEHPRARLLTSLRVYTQREFDYEDDDEVVEDYDPNRVPTLVEAELLERLFSLGFSRLRALALEYTPVGARLAEPLRRCPSLASLRELDLRYAYGGAELCAAIADAEFASGLRVLRLQRNALDPGAVRALLGRGLAQLRVLDLRDNDIGRDGAALLAGADLPALEVLHLYHDDVGPGGAKLLAEAPKLPLPIRRYWAGQSSARNAHATSS